MNKQAIERARDPDLRLSAVALQRAAHRAHRAHDLAHDRAHALARQTGTAVVISRDGVVLPVQPTPAPSATLAQEQAATYEPKR